MPGNTILLVIDAQESFRHRPYWNSNDAEGSIGRLQQLIDGARAQGVPVVQIFHVEVEGVFSLSSGHVKTITGLSIAGGSEVRLLDLECLIAFPSA